MKTLIPFSLIAFLLPLSAELPDRDTLFEMTRHLYRWYMDETDVSEMIETDEVKFFLRSVEQQLDEGDNSTVVEVYLGGTGFAATLKKADYEIPELDVSVKSDSFHITNVYVVSEDPEPADGFEVVTVPYKEMVEHLFRTRNELAFPDEELLGKLREAVREPMWEVIEDKGITMEGEKETLHLASLSPVANEMWVLWERGQVLIRYASDFDLASDAAWQHPDHAFTIYDLSEQVVVSLHEVPGSNAYITRDKAGRALFNCVILGKRIEITPARTN